MTWRSPAAGAPAPRRSDLEILSRLHAPEPRPADSSRGEAYGLLVSLYRAASPALSPTRPTDDRNVPAPARACAATEHPAQRRAPVDPSWQAVAVTGQVIATQTVPWIPVPHQLEIVLARELPPVEQITTVFVFVVDGPGRTLLTYVEREGRGWDLPGGHVEAAEAPAEAAIRELAEETGLVLKADQLSVFAWNRIELTDPVPADHPYASLTFMVMYGVRLRSRACPRGRYPRSECTRAEWLTREEVEEALF